MKKQYVTYTKNQNHIMLKVFGDWNLETLPEIEKALKRVPRSQKIIWDLSGIETFDSAGVLLFSRYLDQFRKETEVVLQGYSKEQEKMYRLLKETQHPYQIPPRDSFLVRLGKQAVALWEDMRDFTAFLGYLFSAMVALLFRPANFRIKEITYHAYASGIGALVIVGLTAFLVGMVVAYQGSVQLAKFGADIFIVDTVAISVVRELGPMITAIVIAGRSGSAYTAEIGAMKITEEIAAMRTMGFDPYYFLVLPRLFALMLTLPLLIFFADIIGIVGGLFAAKMQLGLSATQFVDRLYEILQVKHYLLGLLKAPFFAFIIATIGCFRGFQVSDNTESIGLQTTASVVNAIFLVIACDALFSVIYTEFGV